MAADERAIAIKRDKLQTLLAEKIPELVVNGDVTDRLAENLHVSIPSVPNHAIIVRVRHQPALSTGSACSSGIEAPSYVLQSFGLPEEVVDGAIRIRLDKFTTFQEVESLW